MKEKERCQCLTLCKAFHSHHKPFDIECPPLFLRASEDVAKIRLCFIGVPWRALPLNRDVYLMADISQPPGLARPERRTAVNNVFKDYARFDKYSCETNGQYTE